MCYDRDVDIPDDPRFIDRTGEIFGSLQVTELARLYVQATTGYRSSRWTARCLACGQLRPTPMSVGNLRAHAGTVTGQRGDCSCKAAQAQTTRRRKRAAA